MIKAEQIDFSTATPVVSGAMKFIIPIPKTKGEAFEVKDWEGNSVKGEGFKFTNYKDKCEQAVRTDGKEVIIINGVKPSQAKALIKRVEAFGKKSPYDLNVEELKDLLKYAKNTLGLDDQYNSDKAFIASKMNVMESSNTGTEAYGLHRRDDRDVCKAVFIDGKGEFQGPAATPQKFEHGAVILQQGDSVRLVQPEIFKRDYRHKNGSKISDNKKELKPCFDKSKQLNMAMFKDQKNK